MDEQELRAFAQRFMTDDTPPPGVALFLGASAAWRQLREQLFTAPEAEVAVEITRLALCQAGHEVISKIVAKGKTVALIVCGECSIPERLR